MGMREIQKGRKVLKVLNSDIYIFPNWLASFLPQDNLHRNTQKINFRCPESPKSPKFFVCIDTMPNLI